MYNFFVCLYMQIYFHNTFKQFKIIDEERLGW